MLRTGKTKRGLDFQSLFKNKNSIYDSSTIEELEKDNQDITQNENEKFCGIPRCRRMRRMNNETLLIILISILAIAAISTAFYYLNPLCNPRAEEMITSVNYD